MFKLVLAIAISAGGTGAAQAAAPSHQEEIIRAERHAAGAMPRQIAGPVKIRFRQQASDAMNLAMAAPADFSDLAYRMPMADEMID